MVGPSVRVRVTILSTLTLDSGVGIPHLAHYRHFSRQLTAARPAPISAVYYSPIVRADADVVIKEAFLEPKSIVRSIS